MDSDDGADCEGLKQEGKGGFAACKTSIEEAKARKNKPDEKGAKCEVGVVKFEACVLRVHFNEERISSIRFGGVVDWLLSIISIISKPHMNRTISRMTHDVKSSGSHCS